MEENKIEINLDKELSGKVQEVSEQKKAETIHKIQVENQVPKENQKPKIKPFFIIIFGILGLLLIVILVYLLKLRNNCKLPEAPEGCGYDCVGGPCSCILDCPQKSAIKPIQTSQVASSSALVYESKTPAPSIKPLEVVVTGVTWYSEPKKIEDPGFFDSKSAFDPKYTQYYEMGTTDKGDIIYYVYTSFGLSNSLVVVLKNNNGNLMASFTSDFDNSVLESINSDINIAVITFKDVVVPDKIELNGNIFLKGYKNSVGNVSSNDIKIGETIYGVLYQTRKPDKDYSDILYRTIFLVLPDHTRTDYNLETKIYDDSHSLTVKWDNSSDKQDGYQGYPHIGCGGPTGAGVINDNTSSVQGLSKVGSFSEGEIFRITDAGNPLLKRMYEENYVKYRDASDSLSYNEFVNKPTHFLFKDGLGDYQAYISYDYTVAAECGKPVIYLYPTETTDVNIKVGANVTVSEPIYPKDLGWQVTASPSGQLLYGDKYYDSLFWEGKGWGEYPDYRNYGVIVKQAEVKQTIHRQLNELGLNDKERADFEEFWLDKLPEDKYVRVTWLLTSDMDRLAPLLVNPKPDTSIRIFLEFEGMKKPRPIQNQKLLAPARNGFTLVEWGGLLIK